MEDTSKVRIYGYIPFEGFKNSHLEYDIETSIQEKITNYCEEHKVSIGMDDVEILYNYKGMAMDWCDGFMHFLMDKLGIDIDYDFAYLDKDNIGTVFTTDAIVAAISVDSLRLIYQHTDMRLIGVETENKAIMDWSKENVEDVLSACVSDYSEELYDVFEWCDFWESINNHVEVSYKGEILG